MYSLTDEVRMNEEWANRIRLQIKGMEMLSWQLGNVDESLRFLRDVIDNTEFYGADKPIRGHQTTWREELRVLTHQMWTEGPQILPDVVPDGHFRSLRMLSEQASALAGRFYEQYDPEYIADELSPVGFADIDKLRTEINTVRMTINMVTLTLKHGGIK